MNRSTRWFRTRPLAACFALAALAACGGGGDSGTSPDPGTGAVARIDITPSSPSLIVGQQLQLTATPRDASGRAIAGMAVVWASDDGGRVRVSDAGVLTGVGLGTAHVTAQAGGKTAEVVPAVVTGPAAALVKLTPDSAASVGSARVLRVRVTDAGGSPVGGQTVNWGVTQGNGTLSAASSVSDAAGTASVTWTIGSAGGTQAVSATAAFAGTGVAFSSSVAAGPPDLAFSTVSVSTLLALVADGKSTTTVTVQLRDANNVPAATSGGTVALTVRKGTLSAVTDNHNGTYTALYTAPTTTGGGGDTIAATVNGSPLLKVATVMLTAGPLAAYAVGGSSAVSAGFSVAVTATPVDAFGNRVRDANGRTVSWSVDGDAKLDAATSVVSYDASVKLTAGTVAGTLYHVTARDAAGITGTSVVKVVAAPASVLTSTVAASTHSLPADGKSTLTVTVHLKDAYGNDSGFAPPYITVANSGGAVMTRPVEVAPAVFQSTLTASTGANPAVRITAAFDGSAVADADTVAFTPGPAVKCAISVPNLLPVAGSTQTITLLMQDAYGNTTPAPGHAYLWASAAATFSPAESTTDASGKATTQMTVTSKAGTQGGVTAAESGGFPCTSSTFVTQ